MIKDTTWMEFGNCRSVDPELWFPEVGHLNDTRNAKKICNRCPVMDECLDFALERGERGIWGGMTDVERRRMRLERVS